MGIGPIGQPNGVQNQWMNVLGGGNPAGGQGGRLGGLDQAGLGQLAGGGGNQGIVQLIEQIIQELEQLLQQMGGGGQGGQGAQGAGGGGGGAQGAQDAGGGGGGGAQGAQDAGGGGGGGAQGAQDAGGGGDGGAQGAQGAGGGNGNVGNDPSKNGIMNQAKQVANKYGIPPGVFLSMLNHESSFNPNAVGDGGNSHGLGQVYSPAHPDFDVQRAMHGNNGQPDVGYQLDYSAKMLQGLHNQYGNWYNAVEHYNGSGPQAVQYANTVIGQSNNFA